MSEEKETVNCWKFTMDSGEEITLVSNLSRDRLWMEENHFDEFTPWMFKVRTDVTNAKLKQQLAGSVTTVWGYPIFGVDRVNMKYVREITWVRTETDGLLSNVEIQPPKEWKY